MAPARDALEAVLASVEVRSPRFPVVSNVTGRPFASAEEVRALLPRQLVEPVQWEATLSHLILDLAKTRLVELGPGAQIKSMVRRIDEGAWKALLNVQP